MLNSPDRDTVNSEELTESVRHLRHVCPYSGETMIMGHLRSMGIHVTRERVRSIVRRIDPLNTALSRRPYSVPGPNSLWCIVEQ